MQRPHALRLACWLPAVVAFALFALFGGPATLHASRIAATYDDGPRVPLDAMPVADGEDPPLAMPVNPPAPVVW
jgi:hypothetical protein